MAIPTRTRRKSRRRPRAPEFRVRAATAADTELLVRHNRGMWLDIGLFPTKVVFASAPAYRRWLRREMRAHRYHGFIAETLEGAAVASGAVWLQPVQPRPGIMAGTESPYVMSMYTEPEFRGRGLASRLVESMIQWSRHRRYSRITLHASKQGHPVYERLGFADSNEMRYMLLPFPKGPPRARPARQH
jgi:GNAT superfamily N-acetyltransferase